ncbi:MAG: TatD family hydrolase [Gammaproteobacteria bacterium]|nr:TatD family hydrolase [Gammaproteobacteria bacterium]
MPLIDIGANLGHESFDHDLDSVIGRARAAGIVHMLVTGTSLPSTEKALTIATAYPDFLSLTAGYHPHEAQACTLDNFARIAELARLDNVRAVGETGLDFNRDFSPRSVQEDVFLQHLQLACEIDKPVFLHQRDAHKRLFPILRSCRDDLRAGGVVHCFTGEKHELYDYLDLDMYIGITGWACDERRGSHLLELLHDIPTERLLLETDAPYLLPRTLRPRPKSRRNEPAYLTEVLRVLALTTGRSAMEIAHQTTENARRLFKLSEQEFPGLQLVKRPTQLDF